MSRMGTDGRSSLSVIIRSLSLNMLRAFHRKKLLTADTADTTDKGKGLVKSSAPFAKSAVKCLGWWFGCGCAALSYQWSSFDWETLTCLQHVFELKESSAAHDLCEICQTEFA